MPDHVPDSSTFRLTRAASQHARAPHRPSVTALISHRAALGLLGACTVWLSACTTPTSSHIGPDLKLDTRLSVPVSASAPASATSAASAVVASAIQAPEPLQARVLPGNPDPNSYAHRDDAARLAQALASEWGLDPDRTRAALAQARYREAVARLIMPAPVATAKNWAAYRSRFVEPIRIRAGTAFWRQHEATLRRAEAEYGVPADVIAGILGVETIYGRQTGNFRVLDVLATLSLDFPTGRSDRSPFFRKELGEFLKLCEEQGLAPETVQGSFAGAIGLPQFMPSSIRRYAVDFDGDGKVDLQRSPVDSIGSVAHYLAKQGWLRDQPSYYEVTPPRDPSALEKLLAPDIVPSFSPRDMSDLGAQLPESAQQHPGSLALVQLYNAGDAPTLIAGTANFYAITRYNQSSYYALAVIQLGQVVAKEATRQGASK
ncbi:lytic murein transglycosylase B [Aquabacterium sp.]|uniref:lytic murein transglycosylase B n=1 Tax=Aquabacterium sp. TaxID=1872578 RepID=UPI0025C51CA7|nr:lytic murein transglycosylase B [Aquabacterium sp.]